MQTSRRSPVENIESSAFPFFFEKKPSEPARIQHGPSFGSGNSSTSRRQKSPLGATPTTRTGLCPSTLALFGGASGVTPMHRPLPSSFSTWESPTLRVKSLQSVPSADGGRITAPQNVAMPPLKRAEASAWRDLVHARSQASRAAGSESSARVDLRTASTNACTASAETLSPSMLPPAPSETTAAHARFPSAMQMRPAYPLSWFSGYLSRQSVAHAATGSFWIVLSVSGELMIFWQGAVEGRQVTGESAAIRRRAGHTRRTRSLLCRADPVRRGRERPRGRTKARQGRACGETRRL